MKAGYLVITELFLPTKGGTAIWFDEVYRRLGGKEIAIVTAAVPGDAAHDIDHPNTVHRVALRRVPWLKPESLGMYATLFARSILLALRQRFGAIHAGRALPEGLVAWAVARLTGRPVVVYAHGEELTGWGRGNKYKVMCFVLQHADRVIANSDFTCEVLAGMGVSRERIVIIHPGVDIERFRPGLPFQDLRDSIALPHGARLLLSVGRLSRRKGFDTVIRCLPTLRAAGRDVHYAIVGIGEDRAYLESVARDAGVHERVHLLGHVAMDDLPRWYNACDLFLLVNRDIDGDTEGFGLVFLEAAACGKASIAGKAGGTGSAVLDGITGIRADGDDQAAVAEAIRRLLEDGTQLDALARQAMQRARGEFAWDAVAIRTRAAL
ncbi:glycosyltransferase [Aromatoleum petrolei]|uniref:Glycosyltransferase n=1 Tax=Aromatoleum petrolei TaxID=76116 RepID=A0ABX1ML45_9RHOO|nr:glycosyltransferase [Aromatoleum petrolei]NMF87373.1 glycosyltransferase [Aromatoleum petrolei]QTQ35740.1 Glycosyl transferase, family 1 [Aromatoleum petrolei]